MQHLREQTRKEKTHSISSLQSGKSFPFLALALILLVLLATIILVIQQTHYQHAAAGGNVYYVSPSGSDANPGTQDAPFASVEKADSIATPGTIIHVAPGTYTWPGVYTRSSGTATARITFISDVKWGAKLVPPNVGSHSGNSTWYSEGDYVDVVGFDIAGGSTAGRGIANAGSHTRIIGNRVHDLAIVGININNYTGQDDDTIGNLIFNIGPTTANNQFHGIYHENYGGHIVNNIVYSASGYGIHCWHACNAVTIANNTVFNNRTGGIILGAGDAPGGVIADNMIVSNNISINNAQYGIREYEYPGQNTIGNNNQYLNNIVYGNLYGSFSLLNGHTDAGTITSDAQFVNYRPDGSGDYHLKATSPGIDAGTSIGAPTTDFDGNPRPQGNGYDIGAYENIAPTPTPIPTATPTPLPTNTATPPFNLMQNGSFESTGSNWLSPWGFQSSGKATIKQTSHTKVDGAYSAMVNITKSSSADNAVQLYQRNIPLTQGKSYTFVFWAKATVSRTIRPDVRHGAFPWTPYFSQSVTLTTSWQQYTLTFTAPQTDANGLLEFNLANATGYVWIDTVSLR